MKGQSVLRYDPNGSAAQAYRDWRRRCSAMSKRRASMREGPLADLFRATDESQEPRATPAEDAPSRRAPVAPVGAAPPPRRVRRPSPRPSPPSPSLRARRPRARAPEAEAATSRARRVPRLAPFPIRAPARQPTAPVRAGSLRARATPPRYLAIIRVVGVGGAGLNAIARMIEAEIHGVEFIAINTDAQQLAMSDASVKLQLGRDLTRGLGSGSDPDLGRSAAEESSTASARCCAAPTSCS